MKISRKDRIVELLKPQPGTNLEIGDLLLVQSYQYDTDKVSIIKRLSDGYDPECNLYTHEVKFIPVKQAKKKSREL